GPCPARGGGIAAGGRPEQRECFAGVRRDARGTRQVAAVMTPRQPTEGADPTHLASRMGVPGGVEAAGALPVTDAIQLNHAAIELAAVAGDEGQVRALVNAL